MARNTRVQVYGQSELRDLARDLRRQADGRRRVRELGKELRQAAKPLNVKAKQAARALPSKNQNARRGTPSLRRQIARAVSTNVRLSGNRAGVKVFIDGKKMPPGKRTLHKYVEATPGWTRWRHPVFGNTDKWVTQRSHPFFTRATASAEARAREAVRDVLNRVADDLERNRT